MNKGLLVLLLIAGLAFLLFGGAAAIGNALKRRWAGAASLLAGVVAPRALTLPRLALPSLAKLGMAGIMPWLQLGVLGAIIAAVAAYPLVLRNETRRADRAVVALEDQTNATRTQAAGADLAGDQLGRTDELLGARAENRTRVQVVRRELENSHVEGPIADRGRDLVGELRERAAREHDRAIANYRELNPGDAGATPRASEN